MREKHEFQRSPNMVNGLHHIGIPVNDPDRAIAFYTNILGMEFKETNEEADTRGHFLSSNVPPNVNYESPEGEEDLVNFKLRYQSIRPGEVLGISVARLQAANVETVLFMITGVLTSVYWSLSNLTRTGISLPVIKKQHHANY